MLYVVNILHYIFCWFIYFTLHIIFAKFISIYSKTKTIQNTIYKNNAAQPLPTQWVKFSLLP